MLSVLIMAAALEGASRPDLSWMSGYWLSCEGGREVSEIWTDPRLSLMAGVSVTVRDGRAGFELSRIAPVEASPTAPLAYFAQPEGAPATVFSVVASGEQRVTFEQKGRDYPRRIHYERAADVLSARIEGEVDGQQRTVRWRFRKAELNARC